MAGELKLEFYRGIKTKTDLLQWEARVGGVLYISQMHGPQPTSNGEWWSCMKLRQIGQSTTKMGDGVWLVWLIEQIAPPAVASIPAPALPRKRVQPQKSVSGFTSAPERRTLRTEKRRTQRLRHSGWGRYPNNW